MQSISMTVPLLYCLHFWFSSNSLPSMQWSARLMEVNSIHWMNFHCLIVINWNLIVSKIWKKLNDYSDRNNSLQNFFFCKSFAISQERLNCFSICHVMIRKWRFELNCQLKIIEDPTENFHLICSPFIINYLFICSTICLYSIHLSFLWINDD